MAWPAPGRRRSPACMAPATPASRRIGPRRSTSTRAPPSRPDRGRRGALESDRVVMLGSSILWGNSRMALDRRRLLASAAALGAASALPPAAWSQALAGPPRASVRPVTETLHGVTITDRYRWMETPADPEWTPYLMGQNAYARAVLAAIPGRDALAEKISAVSGALAAIGQVQTA